MKAKFLEAIKSELQDHTIPNGNDLHFAAKACEQIADDFAIRFAEWKDAGNYPHTITDTAELLAIFKSKNNAPN